METAVVRPQLPSYTAITPETKAPDKTEPAAKTDLPAARAVTPAKESTESNESAKRAEQQNAVPARPTQDIVRKNMHDPESDSLIFVAMDRASGEVVRQLPSETLRRLRAYTKTMTADLNQTPTTLRTA